MLTGKFSMKSEICEQMLKTQPVKPVEWSRPRIKYVYAWWDGHFYQPSRFLINQVDYKQRGKIPNSQVIEAILIHLNTEIFLNTWFILKKDSISPFLLFTSKFLVKFYEMACHYIFNSHLLLPQLFISVFFLYY